MLPLPSKFCLQDLTAITNPVFEFKVNPWKRVANDASEKWFRRINLYEENKKTLFLSYGFDEFAAMSFPDADEHHLETCINFFFWAFSFDDLSDEGALQSKPEKHQLGVDKCLEVLKEQNIPCPNFPYAAMLHDLWRRLNAAANPGVCARFSRAAEQWCNSQVKQSTNRANRRTPSVAEFIIMRRHTIGGAMVEAMIEYSLDIDLPDYVFENHIISSMSDATNDIMTWPNDLCSFNKEQADGDDQNLVYCVMVEREIGLQAAVDFVTQMITDRVNEYAELKDQLPSFGAQIDAELARYILALEHFVQGTVEWYYSSRYFRDLDISDRRDLIVTVFPHLPEKIPESSEKDPETQQSSLVRGACEPRKSFTSITYRTFENAPSVL